MKHTSIRHLLAMILLAGISTVHAQQTNAPAPGQGGDCPKNGCEWGGKHRGEGHYGEKNRHRKHHGDEGDEAPAPSPAPAATPAAN